MNPLKGLGGGWVAEVYSMPRLRRAGLVTIAGIAALAWMLHFARAGFGVGPSIVPGDPLHDAVTELAGLSCLARAALVRRDRVPWILLGAGISCYALGEVLWFTWIGMQPSPPYPSVADAFWLLFYALAMIALALLFRQRIHVLQTTLWLDALMGAFVVAAIGTAAAFPAGLGIDGLSPVAAVVNLAYPVLDLTLLAAVVAVFALVGWRPNRMWTSLGGGLALLAVADTAYISVSAQSVAHIGILAPMYALAMLLIGLAAWLEPADLGEVDVGSMRMVALPSMFVLAAAALLGYAAFHHLNPAAVALALATLCGTVPRTALAFRELQTLNESRHEALTDEMTGLANRRALYRTLPAMLQRDGVRLALFLIDLDRFKELNDALGHQLGDGLLRHVAKSLTEALREGDLLVRLGGDEFAVAVSGASASDCPAVACRLGSAVAQPVTLDDMTFSVEASIGASLYPDHGTTLSDLLRHADVAMYQAKRIRSGFELYAQSDDHTSRARLTLLSELRAGIARGELVVVYQPKVSLADGGVTGVEALVRWQHPTRGLLCPGEFLPAAEQSGLIREVTAAVLDRALADCAGWARLGHQVPVAVNLSALDLIDAGFPSKVVDLLAKHGVPPELLRLEVTENLVMADRLRATAVLSQLRDMGIEIALDDFGTGHSSLSHLRHLPIDELKIDRSFVTGMAEDGHNAAIVRATITLARNLGLRVVAEGVEQASEWRLLSALRCTEAQGYLLSAPVAADRVQGLFVRRVAA
jgi:diguanylate cyclase